MSKSLASLFALIGSVALASACTVNPNDPLPSNPNGTSGNNGTTAGSTGSPLAGSSGLPTAGSNGVPNGAGSGTGGAGNPGGGAGTTGGSANPGGGTSPAAGTTGAGGSISVNPGEGPPGYLVQKSWHGCSWTGKEMTGATTVTPMDFVAKPAADAFCVNGSVGPTYESVSLLGFNVNEAPPASCAFKPADTTVLPAVTPTGTGIAVNFVKKGADTSFTLRVQIQGPNGATSAAERWCATVVETQGKIFVPYTSFTPSCWETTDAKKGTPYAKQPISAVVFNVPGKLTPTPYDYCVNGFADGSMASDAPDGPAVAGDQKGVVGSSANPDGDFARAKVVVDGKSYIIQNNNWGNTGGELILNYTNNSFKIASGSGTGASAPASFPSIYIGNNGNTANGVYSTKSTDGLPVQISAIKSLPSTLRYSGSTGSFNATYDIWFANSPPTAEYKDGINGFVMIWLRDPGGKQPIGSVQASNVMVAGMPWNVWVGPRGDGPAGPNNAPVVSFVNPTEDNDSRAQSFKDVDLKAFFTAAATYGIPSTMYLTDVFGGFEIWSGGSGGNLGVDEFKAVVNK